MTDRDKKESSKPTGRPRGRAKPSEANEAKPSEAGELASRPQRYMVKALPAAQLTPMGVNVPPLSPSALFQMLESDPNVEVKQRLAPSRITPFGTGEMPGTDLLVCEMEVDYAKTLRQSLPQVRIETDRLLSYAQAPVISESRSAGPLQPLGLHLTVTFLVRGTRGEPLPAATVIVVGHQGFSQGVTGNDGRTSITLIGETPQSIKYVQFLPAEGYWSLQVNRPSLAVGQDNIVSLKRSISDTFPGFPEQRMFSWGAQAMSLDRISPTLRGKGVKIAIVDSGVDVQHPILGRVTAGVDLVDHAPRGWAVDIVRHGSHCAGVITGTGEEGIYGFVSEAEVHACKIFPGGYFSDLVAAVYYCIDQQIDVMNFSLGAQGFSSDVAEAIAAARQAGVACIAATGNTAGAVSFPGNLPDVLSVAAIGKIGTYPKESTHAGEVLGQANSEGYFAAKFSCHGPEVDVCAPGVAVLSSVPDGGYAVWDGTSMAAPHVTGLAALVLSARDEFRSAYARRDARRVDRLFQVLKESCTPIDLGDPHRTGAGMPDALRALEPVSPSFASPNDNIRQLLEQLLKALSSGGSGGVAPASTASSLSAPAPLEEETDVRRTLRQLNEEVYAAGLNGYGPDPLL
ncbi:S8 family peptidase [Actinocorallia populi]|uniref:S8 family peptidase n=1 Tax=Actinocorallia populi TaxID=2079200 RepID=UPI000D089519|nr:S8 family serine peptidase [Actinocorallia populi]